MRVGITAKRFDAMMEAREDLATIIHVLMPFKKIVAIPPELEREIGKPLFDCPPEWLSI